MENKSLTAEQLKNEEKVREFLENSKKIKLIFGAFGEMENCTGVVEETIEPESGGVFCKLLGCSYLYKGFPNKIIVDTLEVPKAAFMVSYSFLNSKFIRLALALFFIFRRKVFKKYLLLLCNTAIEKSYVLFRRGKLIPDPIKFSASVREIYRVSEIMIGKIKDVNIRDMASKSRNLGCVALDSDAAYRFREQDILPEINKEALKENPIKELKRVFQILYKRELKASQRSKYIRLERLLFLLMRFSPKTKKLIVEFICELDFDKIKLDEADQYFCLQRTSYNFKGLDLKERLKGKEIIDKAKGHFRTRVEMEPAPAPK